MKGLRKLCGAALISGFLLPQVILGSNNQVEAASGKWKSDSKGWWYSYSDGSYAKNKWLEIGGKWYFFNSHGYMVKGWRKVGRSWYYFGTSGVMKTGWQKISGKWYYFDYTGKMCTGWETEIIKGDVEWFYFGNDGAMRTGWQEIDGKTYYFNASGAMLTGEQMIDGKSYLFMADGSLVSDTGNSDDIYETAEARKVLSYINAFRTSSDAWYWNADNKTKTYCTGLGELQYSEELEKVAKLRAKENLIQWTHTRPDGRKNSTAFADVGCKLRFGGECLALQVGTMGFFDAESAIDSLREDDDDYNGQSHRRIMLGKNIKYVGAAMIDNGWEQYWVLEFGY